MRVLSLALALVAADVAVAGLCRPHSSDTTVSESVSSTLGSSTATLSTASTTASETSSETSASESWSVIESSTSASETATSASSLSTTLATTSTIETSASTTVASTTSASATPSGYITGSGPVAGSYFKGTGARFSTPSFAESDDPSISPLSFTLEPSGHLKEAKGQFLCANYRPQGSPARLILCPYDDGAIFNRLVCQRGAGGALSCGVLGGECEYPDPDNFLEFDYCYTFSSTWTHFFTGENGRAFIGDDHPYSGYTAIDLTLL